MKAVRIFLAIATTALIIILSNDANAQMSEYKFTQLFDKSFELLIEGNYSAAMDKLEKLHEADDQHGQVAYLLGLCRVKSGLVDTETQKLLSVATSKYDYYHQRGRVIDRSAPSKAWFYLAQVNAELGFTNQAVSAYRNYMSCIPMATIEHKREVVNAIRVLKESKNAHQQEGVVLLASQKP